MAEAVSREVTDIVTETRKHAEAVTQVAEGPSVRPSLSREPVKTMTDLSFTGFVMWYLRGREGDPLGAGSTLDGGAGGCRSRHHHRHCREWRKKHCCCRRFRS